jgi:tetratricopeptide (TPR) repeat protein
MLRWFSFLVLSLGLTIWAVAQVDQLPRNEKGPGQNQAPPRSDRNAEAGESSSRDTKIDISPPRDDAKNHPSSSTTTDETTDVQELHPWNPHKALKDIEVGDFYFKRKNYRAALDRYQEALVYKPSDAIANFRIAECMEKMDDPDGAVAHYQEYLKILPNGPLSKEAEKNLEKLRNQNKQASSKANDQPKQ